MPQPPPSRPIAPLPPQRRPPAPYSSPPRPAGPPPRTAAGARTAAATAASAPVADKPAPPDLTINKVIAGAGAAATSAVLGSFFGAAGTVLGAALGSVVSMIATTIYQHSLDRTRDTVKARIKLPGGRTVDVAGGKVEVPAPRVAAAGETGRARVYVTPTGLTDQPTAVLSAVSPASPARPPRRWVVPAALTVGVFLIGLLAVTGVELLKGSTLSRGETGTSVGRVVDPRPVSADTTESSETAEPTETMETSTSESTETAEPTATDESNSDAERGADATTDAPQSSSSGDEGDQDATSPVTPTPTRAPSGG
jgi:hypothetical protein